MISDKRNQNSKTKDNHQLSQVLHQLSRISRNSSENTVLVIAYLSLLSFLATGIFGLLISQRFYINSPQRTQVQPPIQQVHKFQ